MSDPVPRAELERLLVGLRQNPPRIAPRYFYDAAGSELFERITQMPEYYLTRSELEILRERGAGIASLVSRGAVLVELGSGNAEKAIALLSQLQAPLGYRPIEICAPALEATVSAVRRRFPRLELAPFRGDFMDPAALRGLPAGAQRLVYYSGSTLGNLEPAEAVTFLRDLRGRLRSGDRLLLGVDLVKDPALLHAAYDDAAGVTAAFNRNVLSHLNARFHGSFRPEQFAHRACYNAARQRIEMYLVPERRLHVELGGETLELDPAQPIHTESSYKFTLAGLAELAQRSGFRLSRTMTDARAWFAEALLTA